MSYKEVKDTIRELEDLRARMTGRGEHDDARRVQRAIDAIKGLIGE